MKVYTNLQDVFNDAYNGLKAQGFVRAVDFAGRCQYRGPNGTKCAIGHCVSDDIAARLGTYGIRVGACNAYPDAHAAANSAFQNIDFYALNNLQESHDFAPSPAQMETSLRRFAERYNLTVPE